jgi:hypothetical protein
LGEDFEGRLGEQLGFPEAGGVILFASNADAEDRVAFEDVEGSDKAGNPEGFVAKPKDWYRLSGFLLGLFARRFRRNNIWVVFFAAGFTVEPFFPQGSWAGSG